MKNSIKNFKHLPNFLIALALLALVSCTAKTQENSSETSSEAIPVKVMELKSGNYHASVYVSGQFTTDDETYLSFKTGGFVNTILVKEGDKVKKGQLLATLDLTEIKAQVNQAQLGFQKAERDYQRVINLHKDSVATLEQLQNSKTALDVARQQLNAAEFNLNYSEIRALNDGYILRKMVNPGQLVGPNNPVFQTNGAGKGNWLLKAGLSDKDWAEISIDDKAEISTDILKNEILNATVIRKSEGVDPFSGTFMVELKITNPENTSIASGLFGKAKISPNKSKQVWAIPYDALLDGNANIGYVFTTNDGIKATKTEVEIERIENNQILIKKGLENAKKLIISGSPYLTDNSTIKVIQ